MAKLSEILRERGYVYQQSSDTLEEITDGQKRTLYLGIDPSADSLHVGNLMGLLVLRRFLEDGHKIVILTGGGTGMIGDPGGKSEERNLLDDETVASNAKAVASQIRQVFGGGDFIEVNNAEWLSRLKLIEFLRDVGKHFTVNAMIKKDIVRDRLQKESPISFTEFSYSLLQGYDYLHLHETYGCDVQVGGSDQWSNILAGVEFIRRKVEKTVYALTWPLLINASTGKKFGKSEQGAVWLDARKTPPFQFYQFWFNTPDDAVEEYLLKMTLMPKVEIDAAMELHRRNPGERQAQAVLAREVTSLVHGSDAATTARAVSDILFGDKNVARLDPAALAMLRNEAPSCKVSTGDNIIDVLVASGLATSKRDARQLVEGKAVTLNNEPVASLERVISDDDLKSGVAFLGKGARFVRVLIRE